MHPSIHAQENPDKPAVIMSAGGASISYRQLDENSNRIAQLFRSMDLQTGDSISIMMENCLAYFEVCWAAQRCGLYYTSISTKLTSDEAAYIVRDSDSKALVVSDELLPLAVGMRDQLAKISLLKTGIARDGFESLDERAAVMPQYPIEDQAFGVEMLYSSGTTGRPKGVKPERPLGAIEQSTGLTELGVRLYDMNSATVFLSPAPLYHAAPLRWCMTVHKFGGTVIVMDKFDAESVLQLIAQYKVTHAQFVPTHFIRMLKLPQEVRSRYDLTSLLCVFHAAAPCPVQVKQEMISWLGPIIHEYYAGTESNGFTAISADEWISHPGSVGRSMWGEVKICDEQDGELPPRNEGAIYFANGPKFSYHKDPSKTAAATNRHGWTTLGDIGWLDEEGYLYLTDRKSFMIISGGVNIYPQEIENLLITHPEVADVAVIGAPDPEMGEKVVAVVQPARPDAAGPDLARSLIEYARAHLSHIKVPRQVDFTEELPRLPTGKLQKRQVRDRYWPSSS